MFRREGSRPLEPHIASHRLDIHLPESRSSLRPRCQYKFHPLGSMPRWMHGLERRKRRNTALLRLSPYDPSRLLIACFALPQSNDGKRTSCPVSPTTQTEPPQTSGDVAPSNLHTSMFQQARLYRLPSAVTSKIQFSDLINCVEFRAKHQFIFNLVLYSAIVVRQWLAFLPNCQIASSGL